MLSGMCKTSPDGYPSKGVLSLWIVILFLLGANSLGAENRWEKLDDGLHLGEFEAKQKSKVCNHEIVILKIDPAYYSFKLLCASEHDCKPRSPKQWCREFGLLAAINASMYQSEDPLKSTGYMKNHDHLNNSHIGRKFGLFMAFNPTESSLPAVQFVDRHVQDNWKSLIRKYNAVVQNFRMISAGEKVSWPQTDEVYGTASIGMDVDQNVLFMLSRSPYSVHDFIHILLSLPIGIRDAMYVEGGKEASLYFKLKDREVELIGVCARDSGRSESKTAPKIPNVIGIGKRKQPINQNRGGKK